MFIHNNGRRNKLCFYFPLGGHNQTNVHPLQELLKVRCFQTLFVHYHPNLPFSISVHRAVVDGGFCTGIEAGGSTGTSVTGLLEKKSCLYKVLPHFCARSKRSGLSFISSLSLLTCIKKSVVFQEEQCFVLFVCSGFGTELVWFGHTQKTVTFLWIYAWWLNYKLWRHLDTY